MASQDIGVPSDHESQREELRRTFETVAELYDRVRPTYPDELFADLARSIPAGGRISRSARAPGKPRSRSLERGFELVALELGAELAAFTRQKLARFPNVEIVNAEFESWTADRSFDAVVAFTSFHWIDPALRYVHAASLLRPGGALAVTEVSHVRVEGDDPFWVEVQEDYDAVVPDPDNRRHRCSPTSVICARKSKPPVSLQGWRFDATSGRSPIAPPSSSISSGPTHRTSHAIRR